MLWRMFMAFHLEACRTIAPKTEGEIYSMRLQRRETCDYRLQMCQMKTKVRCRHGALCCRFNNERQERTHGSVLKKPPARSVMLGWNHNNPFPNQTFNVNVEVLQHSRHLFEPGWCLCRTGPSYLLSFWRHFSWLMDDWKMSSLSVVFLKKLIWYYFGLFSKPEPCFYHPLREEIQTEQHKN